VDSKKVDYQNKVLQVLNFFPSLLNFSFLPSCWSSGYL